jgi:hypothetical protein
MANNLFALGRQKFLEAGINWLTDTIKLALIDTSKVTTDINKDEMFSTYAQAVIGTPQTLVNKTSFYGVARADSVVFPAVTGAPVGALLFYKDTGTANRSPLIAIIDTAQGLPITPNGGDITIAWDTGPYGIFML